MTAAEKIRRVAILVSTLDRASADAVLDQMDPEQAELVRNAIMDLDEIDADEQDGVIQAFLDSNSSSQDDSSSGVELDSSLQQLLKSAPAVASTPQSTDAREDEDDDPPFRFLHEAATDTLAAYLRKEHPQIAAIVIANLPPQRAARVVSGLSPSIRGEVLARVGRRVETDPQIVREIETGLRHIITQRMAEDSRRAAGVGAVRAILEAVDDLDRSEMLGAVAQIDATLAGQLGDSTDTPFAVDTSDRASSPPAEWMERLKLLPREPRMQSSPAPESDSQTQQVDETPKIAEPPPKPVAPLPPMIEFEALIEFDDVALALVFERAEPHVAFLALAGAPIPLVDRITNQLSVREARALRRRIENIGPLRLLDVELAQRQIARCAVQLSQEGKITLPRKRFSVAV